MVKRSPRLFDPEAFSEDELENIFTDREKLLKIMENVVNKFIKKDSRNHLLLIGERGVGKSTLLRYFEKKLIEQKSKKQSIIPLLFTDYKCVHDAQDLSDILLRITDELYQKLDLTLEKKLLWNYDEKLELVEKRLETFPEKKIILMIENLQEIMEMRPQEKGFEGMRAFLENHKNIILIGTTTEMPKSMWKYKSRFWAFFDVHEVKPLSEKHFLEMIEKMARFYGGDILLDDKGKLRNEISIKIRSIFLLVSGYPRLGASLYQVLLLEEPQEIVEYFDSILDHLSPYFEGIDAKLSSQERYVFGQIVRNLSQNVTKTNFSFEDIFEKGPESERGRDRALFSKLKKKGFITVHHKEGRRVYHRLSSPIFGIWYLKTHVKDATFKGRYILEFIYAYFTTEEFIKQFGGLTVPDMASVPIKAAFAKLEKEYMLTAMRLGISLAEKGKHEEALEKFEKAIKATTGKKDKSSELAQLWANKGAILIALGKYQEALKACNKSLDFNPKDTGALNNKSISLITLGRYKEALDFINKVLKINPKDAVLWVNKGLILYRLERYKEALQMFDRALDINPNLESAWSNKSPVLTNLGKPQEGLLASEKALEINPELAFAWNNKSKALIHLRRDLEALEACEKALEINSEIAEAWNNKGLLLTDLGKPQEGLMACEKALEINPGLVEAWNNKGIALNKLGRPQEALDTFEKALRINPNYDKAWNNKGNTLFVLGKHQEALKACDKALKINLKYANAWNNKGNILLYLERHGEAMKAYDKALILSNEKDDWVLISMVKTNRILTLIDSESSLNFREELESLLNNLRKPGVSNHIKIQLLLTLLNNLIRMGNTSLIWEALETLENFEKDFSDDKKIYPSFQPVKLAAEYLEIKAKSPKKGIELLENAPPHLRDEAKLLLGISEGKKRMK